jgi:hypothetical protein
MILCIVEFPVKNMEKIKVKFIQIGTVERRSKGRGEKSVF